MRLDNALANTGIGTRSAVRSLIASGGVTVNGVTAKDPGMQVKEGDHVAVNGSAAIFPARLMGISGLSSQLPSAGATAAQGPMVASSCLMNFVKLTKRKKLKD